MYLYNSIYLCSCKNKTESTVAIPAALRGTKLTLPDLYFCPKCLVLRCNECCIIETVAKYCVNCMTDYSDSPGTTRCIKNCFECVKCSSPLAITALDVGKGKQFTFNCGYCDYSYETEVITKPIPLLKHLRAKADPRFSRLCEKYSHRDSTTLTAQMEQKLQQMSLSANTETKQQFHLNRLGPNLQSLLPPLPTGKHLVAKRSYSCPGCNTKLLDPVADPRLMKYLTKELALDILPLLAAKIGPEELELEGDTQCYLSVTNALPSNANITISTVEKIPSTFNKTETELSVSLPVTSFAVSSRREKMGILESLPTQFLTDATAESRAEKLTRSVTKGNRYSANYEANGLEKGANWATVPFSYSATEDLDCGILPWLPFYVTIETRMPASMNRAITSSGIGLKLGFWALVPVEK